LIYKKYIKRAIDISLSLLGLFLLSPLFVLIALCIKLNSRGPILFGQFRVGKGKVEFRIYKFRTMKIDTPQNVPTWLLDNPESRITKVGKFLRRSSLDELPQIINIIKGEMSIIGPRPVIRDEYELFLERDKNGVYNITPGLTGLAQISGRDVISIKEKARLDGEYARKVSFFLDLKIFLLTIVRVLKSEGVREGVPLITDNNEGNEKLVR
jgi:O-antigen biosynthesis protein WbqP